MTVVAGTFQAHQAIGNREDLENFIYNISPVEFPFQSNAGRSTANAVKHEWQTDSIATAVATNAAIEGDDASQTTVTPTVRLNNYCQIATYAYGISGTQEVVDKAGRKSELAYQLTKFSKQLKRDMESQLTQNKASSAGSAAGARVSGSLESWLSTNWTSLGSGGSPASAGFSTTGVVAPVDNSAAGTVTEAGVKAIIRACWTQGGSPSTIMVGPFNKTKVSGFSGINTQFTNTGGKLATIVGAADTYVSDFGTFRVVPNRFQRDQTLFVLDFDYWSIAYLRSFRQWELAKTGDKESRQILAEYCLVSKNQAASGKVCDLTTS